MTKTQEVLPDRLIVPCMQISSTIQLDRADRVHHQRLVEPQHGEDGKMMIFVRTCLLMLLINIGTTVSLDPCSSYKTKYNRLQNIGFCGVGCHTDSDLEDGWYRLDGEGGDELVLHCKSSIKKINSCNPYACDSSHSINYTICDGVKVYYLTPKSAVYITRHSHCNATSCGKNATCGTTFGSCVCNSGLQLQKIDNKYKCSALQLDTDCQTSDCASDVLNKLDSFLETTSGPVEPKVVTQYLGSIMTVTNLNNTQNSNDTKALINYGNQILATTGKLVSSVVKTTETEEKVTIKIDSMEAEVFMVGRNTTMKTTPSLTASNSSFMIDLIGISKNNNGSANAVFMSYKNMEKILKPTLFNEDNNKTKTMLSSVLSATLPKISNPELPKPVNFTIRYTDAAEIFKRDNEGNISCVYWNETRWVEDGCSLMEENNTFSVCSCTHLSTFALIMQTDPEEYEDEDNDILEVIINVAVSVGLLFLALTILTLTVYHRGHKVTNAALINLCLSLFLAHLIFLLTQQFLSDFIKAELCKVMAGVIHFLFLSAFVWMFIEAVLLYIFVKNLSRVNTTQNDILSWKCLILIGYVIPLVLVGINCGLYPESYNSEKCWLQGCYVWSFLGPVVCIIGINLLLSCMIFFRLKQALLKLDKTVSNLKHTRTLVFKTLIQFVILGCPWVLGLFTEGNTALKTVFLFVNSQQGTVIFVVHCVLNEEIRQQYKKLWLNICSLSKYNSMEDDETRSSHSHFS